ncbi:tRNA1(Val) (adenine(37)-N6)-methyltransferase [Kordia antarctica]|uniref:tRNA1(Val) (adenine(37)-N6)-methyltransferase n=1 Tax=Kordia antarctica TaxID=1218801 RepID=A0A7L4ZQT0_9FLAO|nr:methyltransferase [Kordia antarctica]QHI38244.1 tRNA1(Val) (adenine(37)-N6)-methyltransferase [Kordia antarctica]
MSKPFRFKEFTIQQDKTAMKVGTDGVLLGAWASVESNPFAILDIGAGTGLIALQLAQRSTAEVIDAIEIDDDAYEQAVDNFENSPWSNRLFCYHAGLDEFVDEIEDTYDLIVSNPPFYTEDFKTKNMQRDTARFTDALPFSALLQGVSKLLEPSGTFCTVIPYKECEHFINLAEANGLFPRKICHVKGNPKVDFKRSLLTFSFEETKTTTEELVIETTRHQYTEAYILLTKDFYLKL